MEKEQYLNSLGAKEQEVLRQFSKEILACDKTVAEKLGKLMSVACALCYNQEDVFKYALTVTPNHISFHSMLLYSCPPLMEELKGKLTKVKFQKSCVNFKSLEDFPLAIFKEHMKASAKVDFSLVIDHYKKKKR